MPVKLLQIDAFTDTPFEGNPAAVCLLDGPREEAWMQNVAAEMNLSETAFLVARDDGGFDLRWFTPKTEVSLCGHATLAGAHALWETGALAQDAPATFHTRSGLLTARRKGEWIEMDFPADPPAPAEPPPGLIEALGTVPAAVANGRLLLLAELESEQAVRALAPDFAMLAALDIRGPIVTARCESGRFDFVSRFFAPAIGINEDPVTGAAHCCLGPYWQEKLGKSEFLAYQASARGGVIRVRVCGDRVRLSGQAVTVLDGRLL